MMIETSDLAIFEFRPIHSDLVRFDLFYKDNEEHRRSVYLTATEADTIGTALKGLAHHARLNERGRQ